MEIHDGEIMMLGWSQDFVRAMWNKNWITRILFCLLIGKYAYNEFVGLIQAMEYAKYYPTWEYECQGGNYHKEIQPLDFHNININYYEDKKVSE